MLNPVFVADIRGGAQTAPLHHQGTLPAGRNLHHQDEGGGADAHVGAQGPLIAAARAAGGWRPVFLKYCTKQYP